MIDNIIQRFADMPKEWVVMILAGLPIVELRLAIPVALSFGMSLQKAFWLSALGNALPVVPILFFLEPVSSRLSKFKLFRRFFNWLFERAKKKSGIIQKWETVGLAIFVAIPLPLTGAYSGTIAASLLKMKLRYALIGNLVGILAAGIIVTVLCALGIMSWKVIT